MVAKSAANAGGQVKHFRSSGVIAWTLGFAGTVHQKIFEDEFAVTGAQRAAANRACEPVVIRRVWSRGAGLNANNLINGGTGRTLKARSICHIATISDEAAAANAVRSRSDQACREEAPN